MTVDEARRTLGLGAEDDPIQHFAEFEDARERIAEMVRRAPNETLALRYQEGLIDFDRALAVLREHLAAGVGQPLPELAPPAKRPPSEPETVAPFVAAPVVPPSGPVRVSAESPPPSSPPPPPPAAAEVFQPMVDPPLIEAAVIVPEPEPILPPEKAPTRPLEPAPPSTSAAPVDEEASPQSPSPAEQRPGGAARALVACLGLVVLAGGGYYLWNRQQEANRLQRQEQLAMLEKLGARMIEARQWPEAQEAYARIAALDPRSELIALGRRSIEAGMDEEQKQFVGYWSGEAIAAFEAGRWDDATAAARQVLGKYPNEKEMVELLAKAEQARTTQARDALKRAAEEALAHRQWDAAEASARQLLAQFPEDGAGRSLLDEVRGHREKDARDRARAQELFSAAKVRDQGRFDREALDWLREATGLAPDDAEIAALYQKMASYTRTLHVPGDFDTLAKALADANERDRIVLGEGTWPGPVIVDKPVTLEGAGIGKTIIEADAKESTAATFGPRADGARVVGITFRQTSFDAGEDRFSAVLIRGGALSASDCRFADASGHGVAAIDGGDFIGARCIFENNGWDGIAAKGKGSRLELTECEAVSNFGHGYEVWDGAAASIHSCRARDNSRNGILVDTTAPEVVIGENELRANREFGIVMAAATGGRVHQNVCRENLLGGLVVRFAASRMAVENNRCEKNLGPGLVYEQGLQGGTYSSNTASANEAGKDILSGVVFPPGD